jgi:hypothetical protein
MAGDKDSLIKAKVISEIMKIGLCVDDPNALDDEIALIRKKMKVDTE